MTEATKEQLRELKELFPGKQLISLDAAANTVGIRRETLEADTSFPIMTVSKSRSAHRYVNLIKLAEWLTK